MPPGTGFPFRRLLVSQGLRWWYSNPSPQVKSKLSCFDTDRTENSFQKGAFIVTCVSAKDVK
jgi:hypothetical protein